MLQTTIHQIIDFVADAVKRSNGGGGSRFFLIEDKKTVIEMIRDCSLSQTKIAQHLATHWDDYQKWMGRFTSWGCAYNKGQLNVQMAVAVQRPKRIVEKQTSEDRLLQAMADMFHEEGKSFEDIQKTIDQCFAWLKEDHTHYLRELLDELLADKGRGATIEDLKKVL